MATAPKDAGQQAADTSTVVLTLSPHDVLIGDRLGAFWPDKAAALGRLMAEDGQNDPIKVRRNGPRAAKPWTLVAGHHRLAGAVMENLSIIYAIEVSGDETTLRRMEASENVERGSRSPIERACFVRAIADAAEKRLADQHEGLTTFQIAARGRWEAEKAKAPGVVHDDKLTELEAAHATANFAGAYGWSADVAAAIGLSERSVYMDLALHRAIVAPFPHLYRELAIHPVVGENASALREIAAVKDEGSRRRLIEALIAHPAMTVLEAKIKTGMPVAAPVQAQGASKYQKNAISNLERLSAGDQISMAAPFSAAIKPSAREALRDALTADIEKANAKAGGAS